WHHKIDLWLSSSSPSQSLYLYPYPYLYIRSREVSEPHSPLIPCNQVPLDFITCEEPLDLKGNDTERWQLGYGCSRFGGQKYHEVQYTSVKCYVLREIECFGNRTFVRDGVPCIKYSGHYFLTTLLYSIFLGFAGIDRFCLGHIGTAVAKLITLGGFGVWWIVDIISLITGGLMPEDGSNWQPYT
ncbi:TM2 domain-containing protein, partial [Fragariocoptes setiger]